MRIKLVAATALALVGASLALAQGEAKPRPKSPDEVERISVADAKAALEGKTALLVDVRDPSAFDQEHAKGALSFFRLDSGPGGVALPKHKLIITYCT